MGIYNFHPLHFQLLTKSKAVCVCLILSLALLGAVAPVALLSRDHTWRQSTDSHCSDGSEAIYVSDAQLAATFDVNDAQCRKMCEKSEMCSAYSWRGPTARDSRGNWFTTCYRYFFGRDHVGANCRTYSKCVEGPMDGMIVNSKEAFGSGDVMLVLA